MSVPVNDRVRVEHGRDGEIVVMAAWCGKCKDEVMPVADGEQPRPTPTPVEATVPRRTQMTELPGETWEDAFGNAA